MQPDIEQMSLFNGYAQTLGLTPEQKDKAWSMMQNLRIGRDDPMGLYFCILAKFEDLTDAVDKNIQKAGRGTVANVKKVMDDALASMPERLSGHFDTNMQRVALSLSSSVQETVDREASRRLAVRLGGFALGVAFLTLAAFGGGYVVGRDATTADAARWEALANSPDGGQWLALARMNNITSVLAQSCSVGEREVIAGGERCNLPLFVRPPVASSDGWNSVRLSFAEWSNTLGVWGILGVGAVFGWIGSRLMQGRRQY